MALFKKKKQLITFTLFYFFGYNVWLFFLGKDTRINSLGGHLFSILAPILTSIILFLVYKRLIGSDKTFWLLILLGNISYLLADAITGFYEVLLLQAAPHPSWDDFCFMLQILFYLSAFIYKIRYAGRYVHRLKFTFDTWVIMTVAVTFSWQFIIHDILVQNNHSILSQMAAIGYPIGNIILLFGAISFYFGSDKFLPAKVLHIFIASLLVQMMAGSAHLFLNTSSNLAENLLDPLRSLAIVLMGIAGIYALDSHGQNNQERKERKKYSVKDFISFRLLFPYLSLLLLFMTVVFQDDHTHGLIIGSAVAITLVLLRQIFTAIENQALLAKYHHLTEGLEQKIDERTAELSTKNQQLIKAVQKMKQMAFHDVLSGLPNRRLFLSRLLTAMEEAKQNRHSIAVVFIDLDRFKNINDTLGHEFGDLLLKYVSKQMSKSLRPIDTISRQGGDEFTIILNKVRTKEEIIPLIKRVQSIVAKPIIIKGQELHVSMSVGIALFPEDGKNTEELMKNADMAMYCAKEEGRNDFRFFSKDMNQMVSRKVTLENGLRKAIANDEFVLYYQPQVNIQTGEVVGVEALIRWNSMEAGLVSPKEFIPLAEETRLIIPIGEWVLRTACRQAKAWHDAGHSHLKVAVNLSPLQFLHENLADMVAGVLEETGFNPHYLELEITEGIAFYDAEEAIKKMWIIREMGVRIAIDDFGTGYSSLTYLKRFPINTLKIAQSFIQDITSNHIDRALVKVVASMAHSLGLKVITEGIETNEQLQLLKELHCDEVQGDIYSKPLTVMQLDALIESKLTHSK